MHLWKFFNWWQCSARILIPGLVLIIPEVTISNIDLLSPLKESQPIHGNSNSSSRIKTGVTRALDEEIAGSQVIYTVVWDWQVRKIMEPTYTEPTMLTGPRHRNLLTKLVSRCGSLAVRGNRPVACFRVQFLLLNI